EYRREYLLFLPMLFASCESLKVPTTEIPAILNRFQKSAPSKKASPSILAFLSFSSSSGLSGLDKFSCTQSKSSSAFQLWTSWMVGFKEVFIVVGGMTGREGGSGEQQ